MLDNLTHTQKNLLYLGVAVTVIGGGIGIYAYMNKKESEALLDYAKNVLKYDNDPKKQTNISTGTSIYDLAKKYPGDHKQITAGNTIGGLVVDFNKALKGLGTNLPLFFDTLRKIKNLYTFQLVNTTYEKMYGQSLVNAIKGESKLYSFVFSSSTFEKTNPVIAYMFGQGAQFNPQLSSYLNSLPEA